MEHFSRPRLELIDWEPSPSGKVTNLNDTIDLYRFFDATTQAEFLVKCISETIQTVLPKEVLYLNRYDDLKQFIAKSIEMPDKTIDQLIQFLEQGNGTLSKRALKKEFSQLEPKEIAIFEKKYQDVFNDQNVDIDLTEIHINGIH